MRFKPLLQLQPFLLFESLELLQKDCHPERSKGPRATTQRRAHRGGFFAPLRMTEFHRRSILKTRLMEPPNQSGAFVVLPTPELSSGVIGAI
jgi:hypothetical protein